MLITISASVLLREAFHILAPWIDEITLYYLLTWYVFLSAAVLSRRTAHISVDVFYRSLTPSIQRLVAIAITIVCATLCVYLSSVSIRFVTVAFEQGQTSESGYLPIWIGYLSVPVGLGLTALGYIFNLMYILRDKRGQ
ncbi:MAG: TRAP transporter small permease [Burkholderiales bacterium]|nr:TRAP transporter small permease [Burkholderiales bacterium]